MSEQELRGTLARELKRRLYASLRAADRDDVNEFERQRCYQVADSCWGELARRGYACWESRQDEATD